MRERRCRRHIVSNLTFSSFSFYSTIFLAVFCYFSFRTFNVVIVRLTIRCYHTFDDRERRDKGCDGLRRESCEIAKTKRITRRSSRVKIICCIFFSSFLNFGLSSFVTIFSYFGHGLGVYVCECKWGYNRWEKRKLLRRERRCMIKYHLFTIVTVINIII